LGREPVIRSGDIITEEIEDAEKEPPASR